ncbi:MAG: RiPP maturation radical SAM C-methyltransferase [Cystobacter sp.]
MPFPPESIAQGRPEVCLLSMPFPVLHQPSMALGLLKSSLCEAGIATTTRYPCLEFAEAVGLDVYVAICDSKQEFLVGEWIFAQAAFPDFHPDSEAYLDHVLSAPVTRGLLRRSRFGADPRGALLAARRAAADFIDRMALQTLESRPAIVGCTSTFTQHCASLAVLRRIRELAPEVITLMGGANCEGDMGIATKRCAPWVDFVVSGEADLLLPEFCRKLLDQGREAAALQPPHGVISAAHLRRSPAAPAPRASVQVMDKTSTPDFDDYFAALHASPLHAFISPGLAMETSRGCWWGKKHHCTFCGLNGGNMDFRSKSPDRVVNELSVLSERYGIRKFNVVDNIMDLAYIQKVAPRLAMDKPYTLFFETKANLRRDQLEQIASAGIRRLQPGVETLHDDILKLVDKGTTALQNIQLLKWAREIGIFITWNFLWDVPGEKDAWYGEMAQWLPWVVHLQPPGVDRIQFHRFSPYHQRPAGFGLELSPHPLYAYVYPGSDENLRELAYYFQDSKRKSAKEELEARPHLKQALRAVAEWNRLWGQGGFEAREDKPLLRMSHEGDRLRLRDSRPCALEETFVLEGLARAVFLACDGIQAMSGLLRALEKAGWPGLSPAELQPHLEALIRRRVLLHQNGRYLALALREVSRIPDTDQEFPGGYTDTDAWHHTLGATRP